MHWLVYVQVTAVLNLSPPDASPFMHGRQVGRNEERVEERVDEKLCTLTIGNSLHVPSSCF